MTTNNPPAEFDNQVAAVLAQFLGEWAIEPTRGRQLFAQFQGLDMAAHVRSDAAAATRQKQAGREYEMTAEGVAVIPVCGVLSKAGLSMSEGSSTVALRRKVRNAASDPAVAALLLVFDTPGGTVAGNADAADAIYNARATKPVWGFVEDCCCSAGVWLGSQCDKLFANQTHATFGSIGTYAVLYDTSGAASAAGVKVHVIKAGEFKGAGEPGAAIEPAFLAEVQRRVDELNDAFLAGVSRGRKLSAEAVKSMATGLAFSAAEAVGLGLVDGIDSFENVARLLAHAAKTSLPANLGKAKMTTTERTAATIAQIRELCKGAPSDFVLTQAERGATVEEVAAAFISFQSERIAAGDAALAAAEKERATNAANKSRGVPPIGGRATGGPGKGDDDETGDDETGDPAADFSAAVKVQMQRNPSATRQQAIAAVTRAKPELHKAFLLATNGPQSREIIEQRAKRLAAESAR